jgi:hypothetical protein
MLKIYKIHHSKAEIDRLYVKMKGVGRGMLEVAAAYKAEIINIAKLQKRPVCNHCSKP